MLSTLFLVAALAAPAQPPPRAQPLITGVSSISLTVSDLDRSLAFFTRTLDFQLESREERSGEEIDRTLGLFGTRIQSATLRLGEERIELIDFVTPGGRDIPADSRSNDRWFQHIAIVVSDMDAAFARLRDARVTFASTSPQTLPAWNPSAGGIEAFYFKDPDNHTLEIIHFPPGKGDPKWHRLPADGADERRTPSISEGPEAQSARSRPLYLGIDHTAIVTADTDRALAFYQHIMGLKIVGTSDNYGLEQERLNNVFGAHLRITALRATRGPGIELLEYLTPTTGRDFPPDTRASDLWHWHITLQAEPAAESALRAARAPRVSAAPASPDHPLPSFLVRDPDGHALLITSTASAEPQAQAAP